VAKDDPRANGQQPVGFRRSGGVSADAKASGGPPQQRRVADRLGGSHEHEALDGRDSSSQKRG